MYKRQELCVAIKNDIETSHIPVLLLTALGDENNILDGMSIGADAVSYTHLDVYKRQVTATRTYCQTGSEDCSKRLSAEYSPFRKTDLIFAWHSE